MALGIQVRIVAGSNSFPCPNINISALFPIIWLVLAGLASMEEQSMVELCLQLLGFTKMVLVVVLATR